MLFPVLKKIPLKGKIDIVDVNDNIHSFGSSEPYAKIKLTTKSIQRKLFFKPESLFRRRLYGWRNFN